MNKNFLILLSFFLIITSCSSKRTIVNSGDYSKYLKESAIAGEVEKVKDEIKFWNNRLKKDTGNFVDMLEIATNYLKLFKLSGDIVALQTGDSLLKSSSAKIRNKKPEILYSISQTAITQHQFSQAAAYIEDAKKAEGDLYTIQLLSFDVNMELGNYKQAFKNLESLQDKNSFDYLIRKAKWEDHTGNLDNAIVLMETAFEKIKDKKMSLYIWALSNLADMYGHAGRIKEAYQSYLKVLEKDPSNMYCLKGIAWIAYSNDGNIDEAKRIINYILTQTSMPELKLLLGEIAEAEGDIKGKQRLVQEFITTVSHPGYANMYNKYLIELYAQELNQGDKAVALAEHELKNRFTPETCDLAAWAYYHKGEMKKAIEFSSSYVHNQTFEPDALMHTAFIYADNGRKEEAKELLKACLESEFELGIVVTKQIKEKLQEL